MEDDETFDAGRGSFLNAEGRVQLDAMIMEGHTLRAGGVGCVEHLRHPVQAARKVLEESPHVYLVGRGAETFAEMHGISLCPNDELVLARERERLRLAMGNRPVQLRQPVEFGAAESLKQAEPRLAGDPDPDGGDTVGAVARDGAGHLAAATSTGGILNKTPGRVGDSSLIGCGCYADDESAAASLTGWGEPIMKLVLGKHACDAVRQGATPQQAAMEALTYLCRRLNGHGGLIMVDVRGRIGLAHTTPRMAWALRTDSRDERGIE
jgi:beta-aspartyl-peptidase (threonine type)